MWGQTIFSPFDLSATRSDETHAEQALDAIRSGTQPAVFLDRFEPGEGFSCRRLKNAGRRKLREQIESALRPWKLTSDLEWTPQPHRYCTAWSSSSGALRGDARIDLAFYAVSDDLTGYVFAARSAAGRSIDEHFEPLARSLKTAVAR
ncbi:MAG: hypothetical protein GTO30_16095 [Acidobacteria bacterium]|nr:hypothetical protein [Acidobacteriota bacterium]NIQ85015.1 hypothetical protein [Acidobacteriota bacterium]